MEFPSLPTVSISSAHSPLSSRTPLVRADGQCRHVLTVILPCSHLCSLRGSSHLPCLFLASWAIFPRHLVWRFFRRKNSKRQGVCYGGSEADPVQNLCPLGRQLGQLRVEILSVSQKLLTIKENLLEPLPSCPWPGNSGWNSRHCQEGSGNNWPGTGGTPQLGLSTICSSVLLFPFF
jgi:hypothetical protein